MSSMRDVQHLALDQDRYVNDVIEEAAKGPAEEIPREGEVEDHRLMS